MPQPTLVAIDDEVEFVKTIAQYFGSRGFIVHVALTGTSGIELVEAHRPDVVLMDLKMPGIDGDAALVRIRQIDAKVPVIVITAYSDEGSTRERVLAMGAFAHLEKPLSSMLDLMEVVEQALASTS